MEAAVRTAAAGDGGLPSVSVATRGTLRTGLGAVDAFVQVEFGRSGNESGLQRTLMTRRLSTLCGFLVLLSAPCAAAQSLATGSPDLCRVAFSGRVVGEGSAECRITVYHSLGVRGTVEPVAGALSGEHGEFRLREVPWFRGHEWTYNHAIVAAQARDRVGLLQIRSDGRHAGTEIELRPTCRLRGLVRDAVTGAPIVGASVWPMIFGDPGKDEALIWPTEPLLPWHTRTDTEGRFELAAVPLHDCYVLDVSGPQHGRRLVRVEDETQITEVRLAKAGRIVGRVQLADGAPAVGLTVWARPAQMSARGYLGWRSATVPAR